MEASGSGTMLPWWLLEVEAFFFLEASISRSFCIQEASLFFYTVATDAAVQYQYKLYSTK